MRCVCLEMRMSQNLTTENEEKPREAIVTIVDFAVTWLCPCGARGGAGRPNADNIMGGLSRGEVLEHDCPKCGQLLRFSLPKRPLIQVTSAMPNRHERRAMKAKASGIITGSDR